MILYEKSFLYPYNFTKFPPPPNGLTFTLGGVIHKTVPWGLLADGNGIPHRIFVFDVTSTTAPTGGGNYGYAV